MVTRQVQQLTVMPEIRGQDAEPVGLDRTGEKLVVWHQQPQFAEACFDCDFPRRGMANSFLVVSSFDRRTRNGAQGRVSLAEPEKCVAVEQQPHAM